MHESKSFEKKNSTNLVEMRQSIKVSLVLLATVVLACGVCGFQQQQQQQQPQQESAPEPYSFAYTADSQGGQSSHQESSDGNGRVTGFYTIRGDDGRERRVDYVADENGYRASVKTNEVGTRAESSADAQYEVELPSSGQLEAAKVSYEQYKYLEDVHANERARTSGRGSRSRQQQQQSWQPQSGRLQQFANSNFTTNQQQPQAWSQPGGYAPYQASQGFPLTTSGSATSADLYSRSSSNSTDARNLREVSGQTSSASSVAGSEQSEASINQVYRGQETDGKFQESSVVQSQTQPQRSKLWSNNNRSENRVRPPNFLQQQLEQQFMLQANQLTNQDYPRQTVTNNQEQYATYSTVPGQQQTRTSTSSSSGSQTSAQLNRPSLWLGSVTNEQQSGGRVPYEQVDNGEVTIGQQTNSNQTPITQQQSNIINEPEYSTGGEIQLPEENPTQVFRPQTQQFVTGSIRNNTNTLITNNNNQSVPTGLVSINLSEEQDEVTERPQAQSPQVTIKDTFSTQQQQQQQPQQVELGPSEAPPQQVVSVNMVVREQQQIRQPPPLQQQQVDQQTNYREEQQQILQPPPLPQQVDQQTGYRKEQQQLRQPAAVQQQVDQQINYREEQQQIRQPAALQPQVDQQTNYREEQQQTRQPLSLPQQVSQQTNYKEEQQQIRQPAAVQQQVDQQTNYREEQQQTRQPLSLPQQVSQQTNYREDQRQQVVTIQKPIQPRRPDSIKQIIEQSVSKQPVITTSPIFTQNDNQQQQQEVGVVQNQVEQFKQVSFRPSVVRAPTTLATTTTERPETTDAIELETPTTPRQAKIYFQSNNTITVSSAAATTTTTTPTTHAPVFIEQPQPQISAVKGGNKASSQWMRQRTQIYGGERRLITSAPQSQQVVQRAQWSITSAPTRRPTQTVIFQSTPGPEPSKAPVTYRPTTKVIQSQVDYVNSTRRPDQSNLVQNLNQVQQQQPQVRFQQSNTGGIFDSRQAVGQTKVGSKKTSGRQFWVNNGPSAAYTNQGSFSPSRSSDSYTSFGNRVTATRTSN